MNAGFFLGGWEKSAVLRILKPLIFFDDQMSHLEGTQSHVPSVHVPFGIRNLRQPKVTDHDSVEAHPSDSRLDVDALG